LPVYTSEIRPIVHPLRLQARQAPPGDQGQPLQVVPVTATNFAINKKIFAAAAAQNAASDFV